MRDLTPGLQITAASNYHVAVVTLLGCWFRVSQLRCLLKKQALLAVTVLQGGGKDQLFPPTRLWAVMQLLSVP